MPTPQSVRRECRSRGGNGFSMDVVMANLSRNAAAQTGCAALSRRTAASTLEGDALPAIVARTRCSSTTSNVFSLPANDSLCDVESGVDARLLVGLGKVTVGNKLFVGNLSFGTTQADLEAAFAAAGEVREVAIPVDR